MGGSSSRSSGGRDDRNDTPLPAGAYTSSTLPYEEYADSIGYDWGSNMGSQDREHLFDKYRSAGGTWKLPTPTGPMTIQPFLTPGIQGLLGQQLAAGFGGQASDYQSPLYQPMTIPNYAAGAPLVPKSSSSKDRDRD